VIEITEYRVQLYDYLKNRMTAIAPNLTVMVGELVGARLIAHAGALSSSSSQAPPPLAKGPAPFHLLLPMSGCRHTKLLAISIFAMDSFLF